MSARGNRKKNTTTVYRLIQYILTRKNDACIKLHAIRIVQYFNYQFYSFNIVDICRNPLFAAECEINIVLVTNILQHAATAIME